MKEEGEEEEIEWDIELIEDESVKLKCRVDHKNQVNVLVQNDFMLKNITEAITDISTCCQVFHLNEYPIIIIEARNVGGIADLALLFMELLQTAFDSTEYISFKPDDIVFSGNSLPFTNPNTCEISNPIKDKIKISDDYGDGITHIRTPIYNYYNKDKKQFLNQMRIDLINKYGFKKPTEIIIFTDGFSYSATSFFIKGLQKEGGAIIVGYLGNPNITGVDEFDGSQSPSTVQNYNNTEYSKQLNNLGYHINGITTGETFLNPYEKNQIPREYQLNPVDERVEIYQTYTDEIYEQFVSEGLKIFEKYKTQCNPKNKKLTLFTDDCYNITNLTNLTHEHGGKICGDDGLWTDKCTPIFCDLGYYFDDYTKKCEINACLTESNNKKNDSDKNDSDNSTLVIIIISIIIGLIIILIILVCVYRKLNKDKNESTNIEKIEKDKLIDEELN